MSDAEQPTETLDPAAGFGGESADDRLAKSGGVVAGEIEAGHGAAPDTEASSEELYEQPTDSSSNVKRARLSPTPSKDATEHLEASPGSETLESPNINGLVAEHYNARPVTTLHDREQSSIFRLRNFNNWIKAVLINEYVRPGDAVLDLACGRGGDLKKWQKARVKQIVGVDIAELSIENARQRYAEMKSPKFEADFVVFDAFHREFTKELLPSQEFQIISCQFALHYSFESAESAQTTLANISRSLGPGAFFFGTIPNSQTIQRRLAAAAPSLSFGNDFYRVSFEKALDSRVFGCRYTFQLADAIDDCPEYLIPMAALKILAEDLGLELVERCPFNEFYDRHKRNPRYRDLLYRMNVCGETGQTLSNAEWEIASNNRCSTWD